MLRSSGRIAIEAETKFRSDALPRTVSKCTCLVSVGSVLVWYYLLLHQPVCDLSRDSLIIKCLYYWLDGGDSFLVRGRDLSIGVTTRSALRSSQPFRVGTRRRSTMHLATFPSDRTLTLTSHHYGA